MKGNVTDAVFESFLELEDQADFFDIEISGVPIWERIRHLTYRDIKQSLDLEGGSNGVSKNDSTPRKYLHALKTLGTSSLSKNLLFADSHDVLVYGHPRRKRLDDGRWWDIYFDPIYELLDLEYLHFEGEFQRKHLKPPKTENLRYNDFIKYFANLWQMTGINLPTLTDKGIKKARYIEAEITAEFGVEVSLEEDIRYRLELREPLQRLYRCVLNRVKPEIVLLVVGYGRETFIETCQEMDIPVVELQHGVIHEYHCGYSYPGGRTKETFPDYLFTFGEFWNNAVEYPLPKNRIIEVGYPYLEMKRDDYMEINSHDQVIFISQQMIGEQLSKTAVEVNQRINHNVMYKLHPKTGNEWKQRYPWLDESDVTVVASNQPSLYELFAESSVQVGVGSTALYEGLNFELQTYLLNLPGIGYVKPLVERGYATVANSSDELVDMIETEAQSTIRSDYFFADNAIHNIETQLQQIRSD